MSADWKDDTIAENLEQTRWEYSQNEDRRFLLDPIGEIFKTFRWDGKPERIAPPKRPVSADDTK